MIVSFAVHLLFSAWLLAAVAIAAQIKTARAAPSDSSPAALTSPLDWATVQYFSM